MADRFLELSESDQLNMKKIDRLITQLLISVIAKYCDFSVSCGTIIFLSFRLRQINDLLTNEIRQFTQPRAIIVHYRRRGEWETRRHLKCNSNHFNADFM